MNFYGNVISQGFNFVGQFFQFAILARLLSPEDFGILGVIFAISQFSYIFFDYGFMIFGVRYTVLNRARRSLIGRMLSVSIVIKSIFFLINAVVIVLFHLFNEASEISFWALIGVSAGFYFWALNPIWLLLGFEKGFWIAGLAFIYRILPVLVLIFFQNISIEMFALIYVFFAAFSCVVGIELIRRFFNVHFQPPTWHRVLHVVKRYIDPFLASLMTTGYTTLTVLCASNIIGSVEAGYYLSADRLCRFFVAGLSPVIQSLYPVFVKMHQKNNSAFWPQFMKLTLGILSLAIIVFIIFTEASDEITQVIYGEKYIPRVSELLKMLAPLCIILAISSLFANLVFHVYDSSKKLRNIYLVAGLANAIILLPLINKYKVYGVVYTSIVVELLIVAAMFVFVYRRFNGKHG